MKRTMTATELDQFLTVLIQEKNELVNQKRSTFSPFKRREIGKDIHSLNIDINIAKSQKAALIRI